MTPLENQVIEIKWQKSFAENLADSKKVPNFATLLREKLSERRQIT